jgi:glycosyltransferase involved in cell wall biosynthesis
MSSSPKHRLCLASPVFYPSYGGSQLRFMRYLPGLRARDLDVRVYTGTPHAKEMTAAEEALGWDQYPTGEFMPVTEVAGTPVHRVRLPDSKGKQRTRIYNDKLLECCNHPDYRPHVLQMIGPLKPRSIPLLQQLREMGIPTLYAVTVAPPKPSKKQWLKWSRSHRAQRNLFNLLDCIVTNNEPLLEFVSEAGISTRVEIIANGVDLQRFHPADDKQQTQPLRDTLGISADDIMITTVGGVMPRKGSHLLLEAWSQLASEFPNAHLVLVGPRKDQEQPGLKGFRRQLETLIRDSGAAERVHFTGLRENVEEYQRASDIFVLASEREGMPNSVLEAMASRVAVVLTPFKGLSGDLGSAGTHFLLCDRNARDLSSALRQLLKNPQHRTGFAERGYQWVRQTMSIEQSLDKYAALYHELATTQKRATSA